MRAALDTNVLVYAEGLNGPERREQMEVLLRKILPIVCVPPLVLGELYNVLLKKGRVGRQEASARIQFWSRITTSLQPGEEWMLHAAALASAHQLGIWDAAVVVAAESAGCEVLLSEDLQHGFRWRGVTVVNPFASPAHPLLQSLLASA